MFLLVPLTVAVGGKIVYDLVMSILPALRDQSPVRFKVDGRSIEVDVDHLSRPELERRIAEALRQ